MLMINGGRVLVQHSERSEDKLSKWAREIMKRRGVNRANVACANKLGRIAWAIMHTDARFKLAA